MTQSRIISRRSAVTYGRRLLAAFALAVGLPTTAHAFVLPELATHRSGNSATCAARALEPSAPARSAGQTEGGKSSAILGGQVSALDLIRQQQGQSLTDAAGQFAIGPGLPSYYLTDCFARTTSKSPGSIDAATASTATRSGSAGDFLGSARIRINHTPFNREWQRVSSQGLAPAHSGLTVGLMAQDEVETLSRVNRWANRSVSYVEDVVNYGQRDYWATASETLRSGRGDCEDFAILKYQMLRALGFDRSRMFLTLARDLVRNADHAVLIVEVGDETYMLDNATDTLLPARSSHDYRPMMSFNSQSAWLHGRSRTASASQSAESLPRLAYLSERAVSSARVTGLSR